VVDSRPGTLKELREALLAKLPEAREALEDLTVNLVVNGAMVLSGEAQAPVKDGDRVALVRTLSGG